MPAPFGVVSAASAKLNYDMNQCPTLRKCNLLTKHGVLIIGQIDNENRKQYMAWAPLPDRCRETEAALKIGYYKEVK